MTHIPEEWSRAVSSILCEGDPNKITWTLRAMQEWQAATGSVFRFEPQESMANALSTPGVIGRAVQLWNEKGESYEFFFQHGDISLYAKICLRPSRQAIKVISAHVPVTRTEPIESKMNEAKIELIDFEVLIPSIDGSRVVDRISVKIPVTRDSVTDEMLLTPEAHEKIEQTQARHLGLIAAAELKTIRKRLGLTQKELGDLIQVGEKSYTRWEGGRARPSRSLNVLLCALRDGRLSISYLRSLQKPVVEWWSSPYVEPVMVTPFPLLERTPLDEPRELKVA